MKSRIFTKLLLYAFALGSFSFYSINAQAISRLPRFQKVLYIVLENTNYANAIRQPFLAQLAQGGAQFTNFFADIHPSQGNYLAMVAGDTYGVSTDRNITLNVSHIGDLLERQRRTWKVYAEQYPGNCFLRKSKGKYARKHTPFLSFTNIQASSVRCARIVNASQFDTDVASNLLPNFSFYVPDEDNDGHDTGVAYADKWLTKKFGKLFADPVFLRDTLVIITFDENDGSRENKIYTVLYGAGIRAGTVINERVNHYSLLRLLEDEWRLGTLGKKDLTANRIIGALR